MLPDTIDLCCGPWIGDKQLLQSRNELLLLKQEFGNCSERRVKSLAESCFLVNAIEHHRQGPPLSKAVGDNFGTMETDPPPSPPSSSNNASLLHSTECCA